MSGAYSSTGASAGRRSGSRLLPVISTVTNVAQFAQVARYTTYNHTQPNSLPIGGTDTNFQCKATYKALCAITRVRFFFANRNGVFGDTASANSITIEVSSNVTGSYALLTFSGATTVVIPSLSGVWSDWVDCTIAKDAYFSTIRLDTITAGQKTYGNGLFQHSNGGAVGVDAAVGDTSAVTRIESGVGLTDRTLSNDIPLGNAFYYDARADYVEGKKATNIPMLGIIGDSIVDGYPDNVNLGYIGYVQRAAEAKGYCFYKLSKGAETAQTWRGSTNTTYRKTWIPKFSHVWYAYGINDAIAGRTLAQIQADDIANWQANQTAWIAVGNTGTLWQYMPPLFPNTTSSNSFIDGAGQTVAASETVRKAVNTWRNDGCPLNKNTFAAVAAGDNSATTVRCSVWLAAGTPVGAAGSPLHPLSGGVVRLEALVTDYAGGAGGTDEVWTSNGITNAYTLEGLHPSGVIGDDTRNAHKTVLGATLRLDLILSATF